MVLFVLTMLSFYLPANLIASQQTADEIAQISALPLSYLDKIALQKAIDAYVQTHPEIEGLRIIESLTGEAYVTLYRDGERIVSEQELPASVEEFEFYKSISMFNDDQVGEVFLYVNARPERALILSEKEKAFIARHPTIRVHNEMEWAPFNFNVSGTPKGFSIDYAKLLAEIIGVELEFVHGPTWDEFLELAKSGQLDVMLNIAKSAEREKYLTFTPPYVQMIQQLYTRRDFPLVSGIEELFGLRFAVPKGFYLEGVLKKYPQVEIVEVENTTEAIHAVSIGKADALFDLMPVVNYLMDQLQITNLKVGGEIGIVEGKPIPLHIAVSKKKAPLAGILEKAMQAMTDNELRSLKAKWLGGPKPSVPVVALTSVERAWVKSLKAPLKIANEMDWPPFDFAVDKEAKGLSIDMIQLVAEKVGLSLQFVNGYTWEGLVEKFKAGQIDVLPAVYLTPERQEFMAFTSPYAKNPSVLIVHKDRTDIKTLADLKGKKAGIVAGFATAEVMRERYTQIDQVAAKNVEEGLKAVSLKRTDAFIGSLGVITHILDTSVIPDLQIVGEIMIKTQLETELHMGVLKEKTVLRDILQKGLDAVTSDEWRELRHRWLPLAAGMGKAVEVALTPEERRWLSEHKTQRLGDDFSWPPFSFMDENNRFAGIAAGYVAAISERLGIELEPVTGLTWKEVLEKIKVGEIDILSAVAWTKEREAFLNFTKPYISFPVVVATRKEGIFVDNLNDLTHRNVGVVEGYITQEILARDFPKLVLAPYNNLSSGLEALNKGEITAFVDNLGSITYEIERHKLENIKIAAPTKYRFDLSFGVRKDWPQLVQIIDKALETIDERERAAIKNTWMAIEVKYGFDLKTILLWVTPFAMSALLIIVFVVAWNRRLGIEIRERKKAQHELTIAHDKLGEAMANIEGSINYASRIQRSVLPDTPMIESAFAEHFVLWEPRDVVGGDMYWCDIWGDGMLFILGDCTGHGVPGAFVTLISTGVLERTKADVPAGDVAGLLKRMHQLIQITLGQQADRGESDDGLDLGACWIDSDKKRMTYAGARFDLFIVENGSVSEIKGTKKGIGYRRTSHDQEYAEHTVSLDHGRRFYLTSDGMLDQVGGLKGRMFGKKRFRDLLLSLQDLPMRDQKTRIWKALIDYQGNESRRDDVSIAGFRF